MDYSPVICFETSIFNMDKEKALTKINQQEKSNQRQKIRWQCGSTKHLQITSKYCPVGIYYWKAKKMALGMRISEAEKKKEAEDAVSEEEKCLAEETDGEGEK